MAWLNCELGKSARTSACVGAGAHQGHVGGHAGRGQQGLGVVAQGFAVAVAGAGHGAGRKGLPAAQAQLHRNVAGAALQQLVHAPDAGAGIGRVFHQGRHLGQRGGGQRVAAGVQLVVPLPKALPGGGGARVALHLEGAGGQDHGRRAVGQGRGSFFLVHGRAGWPASTGRFPGRRRVVRPRPRRPAAAAPGSAGAGRWAWSRAAWRFPRPAPSSSCGCQSG